MQRNRVTIFCQGIAACAIWTCSLWMQQSAALAQTSQDTQSEKTSKTKAPKAKKSKEPAGEVISPQSAVPPVAGEKTPAPRKSKKAASDSTSSGSANRAETGGNKQEAQAPVRNASRTEIQSAKTGGQVWVNTDSGVYHKSGRWYGATKQGKFMTEQEAVRAGYKAAKNEK